MRRDLWTGELVNSQALAAGCCKGADRPLGNRATLDSTPLGYIGSVEDVAAAAVYFASDEARYVTGQVLGIDGGMMMGG